MKGEDSSESGSNFLHFQLKFDPALSILYMKKYIGIQKSETKNRRDSFPQIIHHKLIVHKTESIIGHGIHMKGTGKKFCGFF